MRPRLSVPTSLSSRCFLWPQAFWLSGLADFFLITRMVRSRGHVDHDSGIWRCWILSSRCGSDCDLLTSNEKRADVPQLCWLSCVQYEFLHLPQPGNTGAGKLAAWLSIRTSGDGLHLCSAHFHALNSASQLLEGAAGKTAWRLLLFGNSLNSYTGQE